MGRSLGTPDARTGAFASRDDARGDVPPDDDFFDLSADEVFAASHHARPVRRLRAPPAATS